MSDRASPRLSRRELLGVALLGVVLALAMHWPLPLHMGRDIAQDLGDPLVQAWQVAWDGHALAHQPTRLFQANTFWPMPDSLAFSDALVGYAPAGLIGSGTHAAVARYDALFLFAYALCFAGAWLLARELGANRVGAAVAGLAFAYAPWRLEQEGHLHVDLQRRDPARAVPAAARLPARLGRRRSSPAGSSRPGSSRSASRSASCSATCSPPARSPSPSSGGGAGARARRAACSSRPPPGCSASRSPPGCSRAPTCACSTTTPRRDRTIENVAAFSGPPYEFLAAARSSRVWGAATAPAARRTSARSPR